MGLRNEYIFKKIYFSGIVLLSFNAAGADPCDGLINRAGIVRASLLDAYQGSPQNHDQVLIFIRKTFPEFAKTKPISVFYAPDGRVSDTFISQLGAALADYHKHQDVLAKETEQRANLTRPGYQLLPTEQRSVIEAWIKRVGKIDSNLAVKLEGSLALKSPNSAQWKYLTNILTQDSSPLLDITLVATVRKDRQSPAYRFIRNALENEIGPFNRPSSAREDRFVRNVKQASEAERPMILEWLRMLELSDAKKYAQVLELAGKIPDDHPRWVHIMSTIRTTMTTDKEHWKYEKPADQFTELAFWGGNAKNRAQFKRGTTDFERSQLANMLERNELWHQENSRLKQAPKNWDLIHGEHIMMFLRRVEDLDSATYTEVLNALGTWPAADSRWQTLNQRVGKLTYEDIDDFDLAHDIIKNDF